MRSAIFALILLLTSPLFSLDYKVEIEGAQDKQVLKQLKESSETIQLRNKQPISSYQALRKRAVADVKKLNDVCHFYGYLSSEVDFMIVRQVTPVVVFTVELGPLYTIKSLTTVPQCDASFESPSPYLGQGARAEEIMAAEQKALTLLQKNGFTFAKTLRKEVIADGSDHTVAITFFFDTGPAVRFGKTSIQGNTTVKSWRIRKHLHWKPGDLYSIEKIEKAEQSLEKSGLFSKVLVNQEVDQLENGQLPINVVLEEAKHRSFGAGVSYTTSKGPGVAFEWEHRNTRGRGDKLSLDMELWRKFQNVQLALRQPNFRRFDQDRVWLLEFDRQDPLAYFSEATSVSSTIERRINTRTDASWGGKLEALHSKSVEGKDDFYLFKTPAQLKWNNSNNILDPLQGQVIQVKLTPSYQFIRRQFVYLMQTTTGIVYHSFFDDGLTLAAKLSFGNIFCAAEHTIPTPDRFFLGSENTLRGYRYLTVSPLNHKDKPIGGRSMVAGTLEARIRMESGLGWVLFYDTGNVFRQTFLPRGLKLLNSVGAGVRYATPIGPLRLDVAVPLNRRSDIDPYFQIYFSIGHSF